MEIKTNSFEVEYNKEINTVKFQGSLRLSGMDEYAPIVELLNQIADQNPSTLTLDLRALEFLNSSGINVLSKFVIRVRQNKEMGLTVQGSEEIAWQTKSLKNLQRLMPSLTLELQ
ncbi:slr1659 superfamily regulator [Spirulina subsalsa]|uniref:slr1659 superfamily regulator n=1 Tax=Spirulina subsalsa TaxID=54311 RepID=UPI0002E8EE1C|nr:STAS domain-containing protein [Spirulina subsalsa]